MAGARAAGARIVGRTNLHELALGVTGINPWYGTPVNPVDPDAGPGRLVERVGGGGGHRGSRRRLRQRHRGLDPDPRRVLRDGGTQDDLGQDPARRRLAPLARASTRWARWPATSPGWSLGMELLEPGFAVAETTGVTIGRLRPPADPLIDAAVDKALHDAEWPVVELDVPGWDQATGDAGLLLVVEAWESNRALVARDPEGIGTVVRERLAMGASFDAATVAAAWAGQRAWNARWRTCFEQVDFLVTPTLSIFPPLLDDGNDLLVARCTIPVNLAGVPALAIPLPTEGPLPASIQLIGPAHSEERLLAAGAWLESAAAG